MKHYLKLAAISLGLGVALTILISGALYLLAKPAFHPQDGICSNNPACDPSPYLSIGLPWQYGNFDDSSGDTTILNARDPELTPRYYRGFIADIALYSIVSFGAIAGLAWFRRKT